MKGKFRSTRTKSLSRLSSLCWDSLACREQRVLFWLVACFDEILVSDDTNMPGVFVAGRVVLCPVGKDNTSPVDFCQMCFDQSFFPVLVG